MTRIELVLKSQIFQLLFVACLCYINYKLDTHTHEKRSISLETEKTQIQKNPYVDNKGLFSILSTYAATSLTYGAITENTAQNKQSRLISS